MESENVSSSPFFLQTETKESDRQGHGRKKKRGRQVSCCRQRRRVAEKHTALSHIHTFFTGKGKRGGDGGTLTLSLFPCSFPPLPSFSPGWLAQPAVDCENKRELALAQLDEIQQEPHHRSQQTAMSDHASREEVVRRVEAKIKAAREKGEFGRNRDTEQKILSIARNTCGEYLE